MFLVEELLTELHAIQVHYIQAIGLFFWHVGHTRPSKRLGGGEAVWRRSGNSELPVLLLRLHSVGDG